MDKLLAGVAQFQSQVFPAERELFAGLAHTQNPSTLFIACSDSRVLPNLITQTKPGELFIIRVMGNMVPPHGTFGGVSATIEYAVAVLRVEHVIICGHSDCGALRVLLDLDAVSHLPNVREWLKQGEAGRRVVVDNHGHEPLEEQARLLTRYHVATQLANLRTHPSVASRLAAGDLGLHGWHYDIATGEVNVLNEASGEFVPATDLPRADQASLGGAVGLAR